MSLAPGRKQHLGHKHTGIFRICVLVFEFLLSILNDFLLNNWKISQFWLEDGGEEITDKSKTKTYISEIFQFCGVNLC